MITQILKIACLVMTSWFLVACAATSPQRNGPTIEIYPVTYSLSINASDGNQEKSKRQIQQYLKEHKSLLLVQTVQLSWFDKMGEELADMTQSELISMGATPSKIQKKAMSSLKSSRFNFEIAVVQHKVADKNCENAQVQRYFMKDEGCFVNHARWKSFVAPERMLPNLKNRQE